MHLQQRGQKIAFGTDDAEHLFKIKRRGSEVVADFKAEDVETARASLLAAYPDDARSIDRYAERLMRMVA